MTHTDLYFMQEALREARLALSEDEIPVGAILVKNNEIIMTEHNRTRQTQNPLAHAEKLLVDRITASGIKFLQEYILYVTLEPCMMCAGILVWSRLGRLVFAARDPKAGCVGSIYNVLCDKHFNHHPRISSGILGEQSAALLKDFFQAKREN